MIALHAASVLSSALLLFLIEPMVAKAVLPLYGGSPAVWNTCLVFFQGLLLAGYAWAHFGARWLGARGHLAAHGAILLASLALLPPCIPTAGPPASAWPVPSLLGALAVAVGVPFFLLATNASLVQKWHAIRSGESPYFLYALSNVGSFAALVAYPFIVEPNVGLRAQLRLWSFGHAGFVVLAGLALAGAWRAAPSAEAAPSQPPPVGRRLRWTLRSAVPSSLLVAVSLAITTDVASLPLLWVVPLALYLATFVLAFSPGLGFPRRLLVALGAVLISAALGVPTLGTHLLALGLGVPLAILFIGCWVCHADLARDRPAPEHVTDYYLFIAVGGFVGGVFGNLVAPVLFDSIAEYPLSLALVALLFSVGDDQGAALKAAFARRATWLRFAGTAALFGLVVLVARRPVSPPTLWLVPLALLLFSMASWRLPGQFAMSCACAALTVTLGVLPGIKTLETRRSFFGVLRVQESQGRRRLIHGTTLHGVQKIDPVQSEPVSYYAPMSPLVRAVVLQPAGARIAVIGLGAGAIAHYVKAGQTLRFYEIDPIIEPLARRWFSFLAESPGTIEVEVGDARLTLKEAADHTLDLVFVDAFSSDAIPVHLVTVEAVQLYLAKLKPDRFIMLHVSNRHLDLQRVLRAIARRLGLQAVTIHHTPDPDSPSTIDAVALAATPAPLEKLVARGWRPLGDGPEVLWTDDRSNLWSVIGKD